MGSGVAVHFTVQRRLDYIGQTIKNIFVPNLGNYIVAALKKFYKNIKKLEKIYILLKYIFTQVSRIALNHHLIAMVSVNKYLCPRFRFLLTRAPAR